MKKLLILTSLIALFSGHYIGYLQGRRDLIKNPSLALTLIAKEREFSIINREKHISSICWGLSGILDEGKEREFSLFIQPFVKSLIKNNELEVK